MAEHIFDKLVYRSRLYVKKASWSFCVSIVDSSLKPVAHSKIVGSGGPCGSRTEFEVRCNTSCDEDPCATMIPPMDRFSIVYQYCICIGRDSGQLTFWLFLQVQLGRLIGAQINGGVHWNRQKEAKKLKECRNNSTSVPLSRDAQAPIDYERLEHSCELLEQAFHDGLYRLKWGCF